MRSKGHAGIGLLLSSVVFLLYPGDIHNFYLWLWLAIFLGSVTWPDLDLRFELRHRGFTHTLAGAVFFGFMGAVIFGLARLDYAPYGFLGGFTGTLAHILGDAFTHMKFRPLWPLSSREVGFGWFRASDERVNRLFAKLGSLSFTLVLACRLLADCLS